MLKLEQELSEAKALQLKLTAKTSFLVSDIRKVQYFPFKHIQMQIQIPILKIPSEMEVAPRYKLLVH